MAASVPIPATSLTSRSRADRFAASTPVHSAESSLLNISGVTSQDDQCPVPGPAASGACSIAMLPGESDLPPLPSLRSSALVQDKECLASVPPRDTAAQSAINAISGADRQKKTVKRAANTSLNESLSKKSSNHAKSKPPPPRIKKVSRIVINIHRKIFPPISCTFSTQILPTVLHLIHY